APTALPHWALRRQRLRRPTRVPLRSRLARRQPVLLLSAPLRVGRLQPTAPPDGRTPTQPVGTPSPNATQSEPIRFRTDQEQRDEPGRSDSRDNQLPHLRRP